MTENELREKVCAAARAWLGRREDNGSHREIIDVYNTISPLPRGYRMTYQDPWCAAFVSAVGQKVGLGEILYAECACDPMIALYQKAGRFEEQDEAVPRPGDVIFYDWEDSGIGDCRGSSDHVGLVLGVEGDRIQVIEGNKSDAVGLREVHIDSRFIRGYGKPDYLGLADAPEHHGAAGEPEEAIAKEEKHCTLTLPYLQRGDKGECVRALQALLIGRGFRCGPWGADGDFGGATYGALYQFQRARQLSVDGVAGPESWQKLLLG